MYGNNFVIPRNDIYNMKKGKRYPIVSFTSNSFHVSVMVDNSRIVSIEISDPNFLVVFNSYASDAIIPSS